MTIIHTMQLQNEVKNPCCTTGSTRRSESRRYAACLVSTATEQSLVISAKKLAATKASLVEAAAAVYALEAERGMTVAEARAQNKVEHDRWYDVGRIFDVEHEIEAAAGSPRRAVNHDATQKAAKARLVAAGFVDPYDEAGTWGLCIAGDRAKDLLWKVEHHRTRTIGEQSVLSWHLTSSNAQKALGARDATYALGRGDTVEVRTDIAVRETSKKAKKAAEV